jgi:hypothetical protein
MLAGGGHPENGRIGSAFELGVGFLLLALPESERHSVGDGKNSTLGRQKGRTNLRPPVSPLSGVGSTRNTCNSDIHSLHPRGPGSVPTFVADKCPINVSNHRVEILARSAIGAAQKLCHFSHLAFSGRTLQCTGRYTVQVTRLLASDVSTATISFKLP